MEGRYVNVFQPSSETALRVCEVEVYSTEELPVDTFPQWPPPHEYCSSSSCSRDYVLIHDEPKTWSEARTYCRERYTDLATIGSAQDMNRVTDIIGDDFNDFWIGLHEDVVRWRWSLSDEGYYGDGEAEFRGWAGDEHINETGIQRCAAMGDTGEWKHQDCGLLNFFLCFDGRNGAPKTIILVETAKNWTDAQRYCRQYHTDLASVRNQTENQEIQSLVPEGTLVWIGLFEDSWKWSDGSNSSFRYWWQEQPDDGGEGPNCAHVDGWKWSARPCDTKSMFLCHCRC
ncbi:macrophage mannose receptor 1-like [Centroberyx affinis]|uniref:macrophage mannose receptor 1-like n=1 Tax=Centroberyx affinis TaxID=166261 RepID=UPI003A5C3423